MTEGVLYLIPVSLAPIDWDGYLPPAARARALALDYFVVESAKAARRELKNLGHPRPIREILIEALPEDPSAADLDRLLRPLFAGRDCGLMAEAGCPAVADPGALLVRAAHSAGMRVVPLVGPSSILLALMASGLNGQSFTFVGYLPKTDTTRDAAIRKLERESRERGSTQIFIETPYRNSRLLTALLAVCQPRTLLCIATNMTAPDGSVVTHSIAQWRRAPPPDLDKRPTVFLLWTETSAQAGLRQGIQERFA